VKVLVTGASGMLGQVTTQRLLARGDHVTVLQRRASGLPCAEVLGDIADPSVVARATEGQDAAVHLAAKVDVTGRWADYARVNIQGTRNVVAACLAGGVDRLVHVSSPSVAHAGDPLFGAGADPADPARARAMMRPTSWVSPGPHTRCGRTTSTASAGESAASARSSATALDRA